MELKDTYRHKGLRKRLIDTLYQKGIRDERILQAFNLVPRHLFLDKAFEEWAYKDMAFPIDAQQTISMPYTVAKQTELLEVQQGDKILEIGTGSGYQAAVLYQMGAKVYTIERQKLLFYKTSKLLQDIGLTGIRALIGDGFEGAPRFAPFDKIIVTAGSNVLPIKLLDQLKIGGIMVIPMDSGNGQEMIRFVKRDKDKLSKENHGPCAFVPMLEGVE